tara:strand:+ start:134 stop:484 length:351 start_codon:yes stop_codon:yes gene_type:complete
MSLDDLWARAAELDDGDLAQLFAGQASELLRRIAAAALAADRGGGWRVRPSDLEGSSGDPMRREDGVVFEPAEIAAQVIRRHECPKGCDWCRVEFDPERYLVWEGVGRLNFAARSP